MKKSKLNNVNTKIDRIISYSVISIYFFLAVFFITTLFIPDLFSHISYKEKKVELGIFINEGIQLSMSGKEHEAIELYDMVIRSMPDYALAYLNKAISLKRLRQYDDAIKL